MEHRGVQSELAGQNADSMHVSVLRSMLKVSKNTASVIVLAEFGRLPLSFSRWKQALYHDRLLKLSADATGQKILLVQAFKSGIKSSAHRQSDAWCCELVQWLGKKPMHQRGLLGACLTDECMSLGSNMLNRH